MKKFLSPVMAIMFLFAFALTSCSKNCQDCTDCTLAAANTEYCESDYTDEAAFDSAIEVLEATGCNCE